MNEHLRAVRETTLGVRRDLTRPGLPWPETTQAAEGMPRRPWTRAEIEAMVRAGIIDEDERFELIGGEVVPMSPKGARHELVKMELNAYLQKSSPSDLWIGQETTLWLDEISFVEPDFCIWPQAIAPGDQRGHDVRLAIEIADTSLAYDRGRKIGIYAAFGIPEVWVIEAKSLVTYIYRALGAEGYSVRLEAGLDDEVTAQRAPEVAMCLSRLGLQPLQN
jgi:Uma2 family endonuclease